MGEIISMPPKARAGARPRADKRRTCRQEDFVRGQQVLANAIFHWKNDPSEDARAAVRVLMHHVATKFRADDEPMQPRPIQGVPSEAPAPQESGG